MNRLLWRHAEAHEGSPDLSRELTPRGRRQATRMAAWLQAHGPDRPIVIVSPARRTVQTADALGTPYQIDERLAPDADLSVHLAAAGWGGREERDEEERSVILVGHQPTLGRLASLLLAGIEQDWSVKKGGVWWFQRRLRNERPQVVLRAMVTAEMV